MKKFFLAILVLAVFLAGGSIFPASAEEIPSGEMVTAYYFHGNFRCPTCKNMEQYSREVIENDFKALSTSGQLTFKDVNVEQSGNEHFVNDYQLYTKSLVLSLVKDGKEVRSKNLDKIWDYARDKQRFQDYVRNEIAAFLKES